jgi:hypothetical protein
VSRKVIAILGMPDGEERGDAPDVHTNICTILMEDMPASVADTSLMISLVLT